MALPEPLLNSQRNLPYYTIELTDSEVSTILYHLEKATEGKLDGEFPEEIQTIFIKLEGAVDARYEENNNA